MNERSTRSLRFPPVNDVSINIPQNYDELTIVRDFYIVVNSGGEGPLDEKGLVDEHKPYENNCAPVNAHGILSREMRLLDWKDVPIKLPPTFMYLTPGDILCLRGFSKDSKKSLRQ